MITSTRPCHPIYSYKESSKNHLVFTHHNKMVQPTTKMGTYTTLLREAILTSLT